MWDLLCAIAYGVVGSHVLLLWNARSNGPCGQWKQVLANRLTPSQIKKMELVYQERLRISFFSLLLALGVSLWLYFSFAKTRVITTINTTCTSCSTESKCFLFFVFIFLYMTLYMLWPKQHYSMYILRGSTQPKIWWQIYLCMQSSFLRGFVLGFFFYIVYCIWKMNTTTTPYSTHQQSLSYQEQQVQDEVQQQQTIPKKLSTRKKKGVRFQGL